MLSQPKATEEGSFYKVKFDIILLFGMTELKAQIAWNENVSGFHLSFTPTDIGLILRVIFRE
jgi:hypothetical protein